MEMHIGWPQGIWLALALIGIGYDAVHNGEARPVRNIWITLLGYSLAFALFYWGGFFN